MANTSNKTLHLEDDNILLPGKTSTASVEFESEMNLNNLSQKYSKAHIDSLISLKSGCILANSN